jgi:intein/homing endonuclease
MDENEKRIRTKLRDDFVHYAKKCLKIRTKSHGIQPFVLNKAQMYIHQLVEQQKRETGRVRVIIVKGRQQGCSTYTEGRFFWIVTHQFGMRAFILTHDNDATSNLFEMALRYYEHCPLLVRPTLEASNAKELIFAGLDSGYKLGTAGNKSVGRSSTIQLLHGSEVGYWPNATEHAKGILQAVPSTVGTEVFIESTARGVGNYFHEQWQLADKGMSDFIPIFIPWYWDDDYRRDVSDDFMPTYEEDDLKEFYGLSDEQLMWRRYKIMDFSSQGIDGTKAFQQEYPCIVGNQRVGTNKGILIFSQIISDYDTSHGKVLRQWCSGEKEVILLQTKMGYTIECTLDHKIMLSDGTFKEASLLLDKDIVLCPIKTSDDLYIFEYNSMPCVKSKITIDRNFALFLGFYMGDGSYSGNVLSFVFDSKDGKSIEVVYNLIIKLFDRVPAKRYVSENGIELRVHLKGLKELFLNLGIIEIREYGTRRKICVPECIWKSPKKIIKQFLRGLFDSDGFANSKSARISFFSKSEQFSKDIQLLLLSFGITSYRKKEIKKGGSDKHDYTGNSISLRASEARIFGVEIGFVSSRKNDRVKNWIQTNKIGRTAKKIEFTDNVIKIERLGIKKVYDLELKGERHIFECQGIMVHNCNSTEAFQLSGEDSYISPDIVMVARKTKLDDKHGNLLIGADPARFGDDRTSIIRRRGREAYGLESYSKKDTMEVVGILHSIIVREEPTRVFVDIGGLGAGVYDRLVELGFGDIVVDVNSGCTALDQERYVDKRAEMWGTMREWLASTPCSIPDKDSLQADLCSTKYTFDSNSRLRIEKKELMKKRGLRSPDEADALALTFALPATALMETKKKKEEKSAKALASSAKKLDRLKKGAYKL